MKTLSLPRRGRQALSGLWKKTKAALSPTNPGFKQVEVQQRDERSEQLADRPLAEPQVDVYESDKELLIVADVPGARPKDALVSVGEGNTLVLYAAVAAHDSRSRALTGPRSTDWYRSLAVPAAFNPERAKAKLAKGTLEIRVPRKKASAPKLIPVRARG